MASQSKTEQDQQGSSRIPNFFRLNINQRIAALHQRGLLSQEDVQQLTQAATKCSLTLQIR